jgi:3-phenylpropionate/cinnamic acid dioxygenase small subunit
MSTIELQDRKEIEELLYRYAWMVDKRKWELMDDVFAPGATIDYTSTGGVHGPYRETLEWLARALAGWPLNLHAISNVVIEADGDAVRSRCMFMAPMGRMQDDGSQHVILNGGHYYDDLVRTAQGWRIARRVCEQAVMMGQLPPGYQIPA